MEVVCNFFCLLQTGQTLEMFLVIEDGSLGVYCIFVLCEVCHILSDEQYNEVYEKLVLQEGG